jgi:hypothetical protein
MKTGPALILSRVFRAAPRCCEVWPESTFNWLVCQEPILQNSQLKYQTAENKANKV